MKDKIVIKKDSIYKVMRSMKSARLLRWRKALQEALMNKQLMKCPTFTLKLKDIDIVVED